MPRQRSQRIVIALLLGTLALILYGSLYPFDRNPASENKSLIEAIFELSWARAGRGDRVANVLLYAPLGFCLMLWLTGRTRRRVALSATVMIGIVLSFGIEVTQVYIEQRVPSWWDVVLNGAGMLIGAFAGLTWHALGGRMRTTAPASGRSDRSAILVLVLWIAWRLAPYVPQFSLSKLKSTFAPLANPYLSTFETVHFWIWWTLMAYVVFALITTQRGTEALLALIAVILASCLVIAGHSFIPSELVALMLLLPTLYVFARLTPQPRKLLLMVAIIALFIHDSFSPLRWRDSVGRFDLWPFMAWIDAGFQVDTEWLARRACYFAAIAWSLKEAGISLKQSSLAVPAISFAVELAQLFVAGKESSITEPALAFLIVWCMRLVEAPNSIRQHARSR